ncbi:MAG: Txe/YoeB family addiction module toxin [Syntrophobacteraceae bacterium]
MNIRFTQAAWQDFEWFLDNDKRIAQRIRRLLQEIIRNPEEGVGKPEKLRFQLAGCWSRRITQEHRLVYKVNGDDIIVLSCRYHYEP